jgi:hypothetical protein
MNACRFLGEPPDQMRGRCMIASVKRGGGAVVATTVEWEHRYVSGRVEREGAKP